ncbi:MAG: hypothetical protein ACKVRN_09885 [Pyrinomonadaceae bacterium]
MIDSPTDIFTGNPSVKADVRREKTVSAERDSETAVELGIWLSGLESFLSSGHYMFRARDAAKPLADCSKEFRLTQSTLLRCLKLNSRLLVEQSQNEHAAQNALTNSELDELAAALRDTVQIGECIIRAEPLGIGEWKAWGSLLSEKFNLLSAFHKLIRHAETSGEQFLPEPLKSFAATETPMSAENAELALILPRFAKILKWLSVVGKMLQADEPLKPALVIFSRINDQISDLLSYINNRLERFPDEEAELFGSLDAASYTASIELKKVYTHELSGIVELRPAPAIYSGMETSYSMLNESFQHTLAGLARLIDPTVDVISLFPSFRVNFERSMSLRSELWKIVRLTQAAEHDPEKPHIEALNKALREFMNSTFHFLYYKDTETFERFVEEILVTKQNKDLVPILHRFGAYLETLFGQVSMRAVLEKHPFNA